MQVVILAGGLGTRLRSVAPDTPKALVPVAGEPFIERQFELLKKNGLKEVLLCIGFQGDQIERHVGDGSRFGMRVKYSYEDPKALLGTGGALLNALMVRCTDEFEKLPLQKDMDLMRNILYGGIWTRYNLKTQARAGKERRR